ncbi:MAG: hypothetical protein HQM12_18070 [SAR324 cluster bacterium]|nr:hypothetical protein [SAR324 cluster bacterium]
MMEAVFRRDLKSLKYWLNQGADVHYQIPNWSSVGTLYSEIIHDTIQTNDVLIVREILQAGATLLKGQLRVYLESAEEIPEAIRKELQSWFQEHPESLLDDPPIPELPDFKEVLIQNISETVNFNEFQEDLFEIMVGTVFFSDWEILAVGKDHVLLKNWKDNLEYTIPFSRIERVFEMPGFVTFEGPAYQQYPTEHRCHV